jgi:molybdopterin synthase catalytic subunit
MQPQPPAGGDDWVGLHDQSITVESIVSFVTAPAAGGIDVFLGTTRAETDAAGRRLVALDYEAYEEMAGAQLRDLAARARAQWPVVRLAVLHRVGRVPVGRPSVVIAVACPHRAEAFDACRWLIDTLKADVAIWKKEVWDDGTGRWAREEETMNGER